MIAQTFATQHPSRTKGLVLLSSLARTNLPPNIKWKADNLLPMLEYLGKCEQNNLLVTFIQLISNCHTPFYFFINSFYFIFLFWLLKESEWVVRSRPMYFRHQLRLHFGSFWIAVFSFLSFYFVLFRHFQYTIICKITMRIKIS